MYIKTSENTNFICYLQVHTFDVSLDRGWHLRLGFSIWGPINGGPDSPRNVLPDAAEVKAVYPGSLADKDGRIKVGDRILEVFLYLFIYTYPVTLIGLYLFEMSYILALKVFFFFLNLKIFLLLFLNLPYSESFQ